MRIDFNALLYSKVQKEYDAFVDELAKLPPEEIIKHSYEKVFKEDITMCFEELELEPNEAKALLKKKNPLDFVYQEWLKNDCSYMDVIRDTIDDSCKIAVRDLKKALSRGDR